jgi:hypothetical protein
MKQLNLKTANNKIIIGIIFLLVVMLFILCGVFIVQKYKFLFQANNQKETQQITEIVNNNDQESQKADDSEARQLLDDFCLNAKKRGMYQKYYACGDFLNMDKDFLDVDDDYFAGLCCNSEEAYGEDYYIFVVLEPFEGGWGFSEKYFSKILERSYSFEKFKVVDIDDFPANAVTWEDAAWTMDSRLITSWVYSPKYDEYFYKKNYYNYDYEKKEWLLETSYSNNLTEEFKIFKEYLSKL